MLKLSAIIIYFTYRYWQEHGYLIIYVSSRLLFQKGQVLSWLRAHNFPFGILSFCETVSKDYQKHKIDFLKKIGKHVSTYRLHQLSSPKGRTLLWTAQNYTLFNIQVDFSTIIIMYFASFKSRKKITISFSSKVYGNLNSEDSPTMIEAKKKFNEFKESYND